MTDRDPALEPFEALIGTWATEATHPLFDAVVPGSITFQWLEGGHFLVQRSRNEHLARRPRLRPALLRHAGPRPRRRPMAARPYPGDRQDDLKVTYRRRD